MKTLIWWIRRDLRLTDNQALTHACSQADRVLPVFILDPTLLNSPYASNLRTAFLFRGLHALDADLRAQGSRLILCAGEPSSQLARLRAESNAAGVVAERDHSPYATKRDSRIARDLPLILTDGVSIQSPQNVLKDDGTPYVVYTPYSKRWRTLTHIEREDILPAPEFINTPNQINSHPLPEASTLTPQGAFPAGEMEAKRRLGAFIKGPNALVFDYAKYRDRPDFDGTAQLSPYLRFGMISPRLAALGALTAIQNATNQDGRQGAETWLSELIWRDFYITILAHYPHVRAGSFRPNYNGIAWENNKEDFVAWCEGRTGYPLIDAAMRQLNASGWMHNRARMATASFLVKDLLIDWRWGERYFMQRLIDGDPAANNGGWQWSAGTGTDAAPYFRIFNPVSQGTKFDPNGAYVRRWIPELARVPDKLIHEPWKMSRSEQKEARCIIGADYPAPIVDHQFARERTLAAYKVIKNDK